VDEQDWNNLIALLSFMLKKFQGHVMLTHHISLPSRHTRVKITTSLSLYCSAQHLSEAFVLIEMN
jgi:hypothetical protein